MLTDIQEIVSLNSYLWLLKAPLTRIPYNLFSTNALKISIIFLCLRYQNNASSWKFYMENLFNVWNWSFKQFPIFMAILQVIIMIFKKGFTEINLSQQSRLLKIIFFNKEFLGFYYLSIIFLSSFVSCAHSEIKIHLQRSYYLILSIQDVEFKMLFSFSVPTAIWMFFFVSAKRFKVFAKVLHQYWCRTMF